MADPNIKSNWRAVAFMIFLIMLVILLSVSLFIAYDIFNNDRITSIFFGVTAGLTAWMITFLVTNKFYNSLADKTIAKLVDLERSFKPHDDTTTTILNVVQCKFMTLIDYNRKNLLNTGFYEKNYENADDIKISAITLNDFLAYLCCEKTIRGEKHLINQLKKRENINVKVLFMHPNSEVVKIMDKLEGSNINKKPVTKKIRKSITLLEEFSKIEEGCLKKGSKLEVGLTTETLNSTITYAGKKEKNPHDVLLIGMLFGHKRGGPLYQVPNTNEFDLYKDSLDYFDVLYSRAKNNIIFSWSDSSEKLFEFKSLPTRVPSSIAGKEKNI